MSNYDVVVIGAGVVGSLTALELSKHNISVCLVDRFPEPGCGTSKANSAIVHAGYDADPGTAKAALNVRGCGMMEALCGELDVPYLRTGSMVLAFSEEEARKIQALLERGRQNGVKGLEIIGRERVLELEPQVNPEVFAALYAPDAGIVCPYELTVAAAESALDNGVEARFDFPVERLERENGMFRVISKSGEIRAAFVINCAGVYSDLFCGEPSFRIQPRKGEYLILDRKYDGLVHHVLFRTPTKLGKGILAAPTVHGNLLLGPTSEPIEDREDTDTTAKGLGLIRESSKYMLPGLDLRGVITSFAGLRATPSTGDFLIGWSSGQEGLLNAAGIESPGLTSAPAIALKLVELLGERLPLQKKAHFHGRQKVLRMAELSLEEKNKVIRENPAYGRVVCRCECVSEGEIVDAIRRNAGARTVDGVKRRVRAGMGRCQGSFCMPGVLELLSRELGVSQTELTKSGGLSRMLTGTLKGEE
ncbi:MAG: NAD(P)/FAD-dependent oxidoreductase [Clostridia bacterium]|nr:NAD(P)/FAD-dependent oxidoreductase [Clostridia bacterium]